MVEEERWVSLAQKGDKEAFCQLIRAYQAPVYNLAYRMLGDPDEAEDATQETFLRAFSRLHTYDPGYKFSSWILSIASHYCLDQLRKRKGRFVSLEGIKSWRWMPDRRPQPEERFLQHEEQVAVRRILSKLPPQYRVVVILRYWYGYSYEEMARMLETSQSAIKSRLHRARKMMAKLLQVSEEKQVSKESRDALPASL